jgi:hypothetical protein
MAISIFIFERTVYNIPAPPPFPQYTVKTSLFEHLFIRLPFLDDPNLRYPT